MYSTKVLCAFLALKNTRYIFQMPEKKAQVLVEKSTKVGEIPPFGLGHQVFPSPSFCEKEVLFSLFLFLLSLPSFKTFYKIFF